MPTKPKGLIVWGAGGHARVVADIVQLHGRHRIVAFVDDGGTADQPDKFLGIQLLSEREKLALLLKRGCREMVIAIGNCSTRLRLAAEAQQIGFDLCEPLVHPKATVARSATLGRGTVVAAGAVVNPAAILGENVIVNTCASVDHDCILENGVHVCPGAHLAGNVTVCRGTWIGIGATVIEKIRIGKGVMIGAGAVVVSNVPDGVLALGCPARVVVDAQMPAVCV
jgi:acetyltransferase EpsM